MKGKVLVIENEKYWSELLTRVLEKSGFYVVIAENLDAAVKLSTKEMWHFIVVDMQLDAGNTNAEKFEGWDILQLLKKLNIQDTTPAMVFTGWAREYMDLHRKKQLRSIFFMSKGEYDKNEFINTIERAVEAKNLRFKDDHRGD